MTQQRTKGAPTGDPSRKAGADPEKKRGYRDTLNLPKTAFPMKANLVQNEPASEQRWRKMGLYDRVMDARRGSPRGRFVFHDGPPYANGAIHLGHLFNKSLKDFVVRSRLMSGRECPFVPGWDCHGLPIEHKVVSDLHEAGKLDKLRSLPEDQRRMAVRRECKRHAEKFIKLQSAQMQRLLTLADYERPYYTMSPDYEGATLEVLADLVEQGLVYRALKPVHWSIANETALAEAELEYEQREDISIYVDFEAEDPEAVYDAFGLPEAVPPDDGDDDTDTRPAQRPCFMIWTTTPWTLPANLAIAVHPDIDYALVKVDGNVTVVAHKLVERVTAAAKAEDVRVLATAPGSKLIGLRYRHAFRESPPVPEHQPGTPEAAAENGVAPSSSSVWSIVAAEYVTLEEGTGLVHTAPGHGAEDYHTGLRCGLPVYSPVQADGTFDDTAPDWLRGLSVWKANELITERLRDSGHLFYDHRFTHSYPHDWRSKTPVIFRCTEQWFVAVDKPTRRNATPLRELALDKTREGVRFVPEWGSNRLRGMVESRPDWCISRQRAWGLPIPAFYLPDGAPFMTAASVRAVARAVREKGSDAWFTAPPHELLAHYDPAADPDAPEQVKAHSANLEALELEKGHDIFDVWFESGSSWNAVMRERDLGYPADLYLEGSDQHRGWFQLSLLPALGVTGEPPYRALVTHGFMVDKDGRKLSKSKGDTVDDLFMKFGADVMRWWVASLAYENDVKADPEFYTLAGESYRKVRNTLRFMLSNLPDFDPAAHALPTADFHPASPDAWALAEYNRLARAVIDAYERYDFRAAHNLLYNFCNETLSAVYLAAVKDRLYCDKPDSPRRRRAQSALHLLTDGLCRLLAPLLPHTADEAYRALHNAAPDDHDTCVHLETWIESVEVTADPGWPAVMAARHRALHALERAKSETGVENPLDAAITLPDPDGSLARFDPADLADLLGVSRAAADASAAEIAIRDLRAEPRCERCWKRDGTVKPRSDGGQLSDRDAEALGLT